MTTPSTDSPATPLTPSSDDVRGRFLWYDLMTPDVDASTAFYTGVTGWTLTPWEMMPGMPPYTMWTNGQSPLGGTMRLPENEIARGTPAHWIAYIGTPDCDATYAAALAAGATSCAAPQDIPSVGRFAVLADPQGAVFAAFQPLNASPASPPDVGTFTWHELITRGTSSDAALAFYQTLFGWDQTSSMDMGPDGAYVMYGRNGVPWGGVYAIPAAKEDGAPPPLWQCYVRVADLDAAVAQVKALGGTVRQGPMDVPGGDRVATCTDPHGAPFGLHQVKA